MAASHNRMAKASEDRLSDHDWEQSRLHPYYTQRVIEKVGPLQELAAAEGQNTPRIASSLVISRKTAGHHLEHIYNKLGVSSRTAAVVYAVQQGLA